MNTKDDYLQPGHFLGLKFEEGWWFIQVIGTEYVELKPWILLNESDNRAEIAATTAGSEDDEIEDTLNNRIIEPNDSARNTIFQVRYGIDPSRVQIFPIFGRDRNTALERYDEPGDPAPIVNGHDSPYNDPTEETEFFYVNSMSPVSIQAYNPMDVASEARLSIHVNKLRYTTITDRSLMKAMLQGQKRAKISNAGMGVRNADQIEMPNWLNDAFGEHIYTTREILDAQTSGSGQSPLPDGSNLQGGGN